MKILGLLRHAKSDWADPALADFDRPLTPRGRAAATAMGPVLESCNFDLVVASGAARVRQTLEFAGIGPTVWNDSIYGAGPAAITALVAAADDAVDRLLIAGHNPTLHRLAMSLAVDGEESVRAALSEKFPTGALALLELPIARWRDIPGAGGRLARFVRPKDL